MRSGYDRALALRPGYVEALYNRGVVLQDSRRYEEAVPTFARLLAIAPDRRYAAGKPHYLRLLCCAWATYPADTARLIAAVAAGRGVCDPFSFTALPGADLFLDTLPYNAHTAASDALWSGLPVLTCAGDTFAGRGRRAPAARGRIAGTDHPGSRKLRRPRARPRRSVWCRNSEAGCARVSRAARSGPDGCGSSFATGC